MNPIVKAAFEYKRHGYSVVPISANKTGHLDWKQYQYHVMDDNVLRKEFSRHHVSGIAVICGKISGNLELIDMDAKNDLTGSLVRDFHHRLDERDPGLINQLVKGSTINHGLHFYYRCAEIGRSTPLARRPSTIEELAREPKRKVRVLIETKAEAGYGVAPPTPGYHFLHRSLLDVCTITPGERTTLFEVARSFHIYPEPLIRPVIPRSSPFDPEKPFDAYNNDPDRKRLLIRLLTDHNWTLVYEFYPRTYFKRPGNTDHKTSGDYHEELNLFTVFTTSTEFTAEKGYRPSAVYAILECGGDFRLAAKKLLAAGYGVPYSQRRHVWAGW